MRGEALARVGRVCGHADEDRARLCDRGPRVSERTSLLRATGSLVLGIEIEHYTLSFERSEVNGGTVLRRGGEIRRGLADD